VSHDRESIEWLAHTTVSMDPTDSAARSGNSVLEIQTAIALFRESEIYCGGARQMPANSRFRRRYTERL